jgi:hypothetical protein
MTDKWTGGCLCGALRYTCDGAPDYTGHCYCEDCRKASGSGFIPFASFQATNFHVTGDVRTHTLTLSDGRLADRNFCPHCGGLVFGGVLGKSGSHTVYAGSLDNPALFKPQIAIFMAQRAPWAAVPPGLKEFDRMPE